MSRVLVVLPIADTPWSDTRPGPVLPATLPHPVAIRPPPLRNIGVASTISFQRVIQTHDCACLSGIPDKDTQGV
ncbi:hypothetical protein HBI04_106740 [Parastagonospora nodorum]|nr:hypothetical protein HBI03_142670 [Parastagonospora nodorum]KAH4276297.1 hypothetical protein HBI04_106740 [Parastagonospora nodorum]KAH5320017.1 hypothetical protein HBI50_109990 [Parastagonospora nodorum]KAH6228218.1 hypothetical protein HBI53_041050 [Parastagonospora nodorum]KAH6300463.1 hypothetical protein HBI39_134750 [Parastagonospora nodorum]